MKTVKKALVLGLAAGMATGLAFSASAQATGNVKTEISTAHAHALMAQSANTVAMAHTHLHHVINCLVGTDGTGFDTKAGDPCKGQGDGAIPGSANDSAVHGKLEKALTTAQSGLKSNDLATIHTDAGKIAADLGATPSQKSSGAYSW
ncbi:MAG: hypothetical protein ACREP2_05800 [Rhodanobacteraceae bacterium]